MWMFLLKWLPFLSKLGGLSTLFAWVPGAQIFSVVGAIAGLLVSFVRWVFKDIEDAFKQPQVLAVRTICFLAVLAFGVYQGIRWDAHKVEKARGEIAQMKKDWEDRDREDARKSQAAQAAREKAEREAREALAKAPPAAAPPADAGVRPKARAKPKAQPGLFGGLFGNT